MFATHLPVRRTRRVLRAATVSALTTAAAVGLAITSAPPAGAVSFGQAYWNVASDGGVFTHGPAGFHGSEGGRTLNAPVVGGAAFPFFEGYWLVASDGGVFNHGSADFFGSDGGRKLNAPVVGMAATPSGKGYWLAASDGGVFTHGDAGFFGSEGTTKLNSPVVGIGATNSGLGYRLVGRDGGVFTHGDAAFLGSEGGTKLSKPVVGILTRPAFGIKVDPFQAATGSTDSSSWGPTGGKLTVTDAVAESGGDIPAGARVLGVEGLTGAQLGTVSYDVDSGGPCDGSNPRINVYLDVNGDGVGDPASTVSLACSGSVPGTFSFTLTGGNATATVTGMDVIQGAVGATAVLDNIKVAGVTVSDFTTVRRAE